MPKSTSSRDPAQLVAREYSDFFRFFFKTPAKSRRVVFYGEHEGYYSYFEGIINELCRHNQPVAYVTSDPEDPVFKTGNPLVTAFYQDKMLPFFMWFVRSPVFVMTLTDLHKFHLKRSFFPVHYVYVFHAMVSVHQMYRPGAFDHYDSILCAGPHHVRELRHEEKMRSLKPRQLIEAGYYRLERIHRNYQEFQKSSRPDAPPTVLIAPSWGEKNIIESCGMELSKILRGENYKVIMRPHPETVRRNPEILNKIQEQFKDDPNFQLERSVSTDDSLLEADVLICDMSGVALEYALGTLRRVLFINVPPKVKNPDFAKWIIEPLELELRPEIGVELAPENLQKVPDVVKDLMASREEFKEKLEEIRNKTVFNLGSSSGISCDHIMKILNNYRDKGGNQ